MVTLHNPPPHEHGNPTQTGYRIKLENIPKQNLGLDLKTGWGLNNQYDIIPAPILDQSSNQYHMLPLPMNITTDSQNHNSKDQMGEELRTDIDTILQNVGGGFTDLPIENPRPNMEGLGTTLGTGEHRHRYGNVPRGQPAQDELSQPRQETGRQLEVDIMGHKVLGGSHT